MSGSIARPRKTTPSPQARRLHIAAGLCAAVLAQAALPGTTAAASSSSIAAAADAHVSSAHPNTNYGASAYLRLDAVPVSTGYLRFDVAGLGATVTKATLRVFTNSADASGIEARAFAAGSWSEGTITYANAPAASAAVLSRSGGFGRAEWVSLDVTAAVNGNGAVSLALTTTSAKSLLSVDSREAGADVAPRLVVETGATEPPPSPGGLFERRPYTDASPWNTPIPANVAVNPNSAASVATIGAPITSDPGQYTYPVYFVDATTPLKNVKVSGVFSEVSGIGISDLALQILSAPLVPVPARDGFSAAAGTDGQIIIIDTKTGDEWSFWQLRKDAAGNWLATNGSHYNVYPDGHPPRSASGQAFTARGAGVTYLSGLIRPWEIKQGRIDHALAFAYNYPAPKWIYPASKSDGKNTDPNALPEGARLQLDPGITESELRAAGCSTAAIVIARAMQQYGMYVIDNSGRPKIMLEYNGTANPAWSTLGVGTSTHSCIPIRRLRWVASPSSIDQ